MSQDNLIKFEQLTSKFIEELRDISSETKLLHEKELKKAFKLIYGTKAIISSVENQIREVEKRLKKSTKSP